MRHFLIQKTYNTKLLLKKQLKSTFKILMWTYTNQNYYLKTHQFDEESFDSTVTLTNPQRQQCFCFFDLSKQQQITFTAGRFLNQYYTPAKFYKRSIKNVGGIVMALKKQYLPIFRRIFLIKILNLNYKQWVFWDKFDDTIHPTVKFFLHKKSYLPRWQGKRRVKRVVLRMLTKQ